MEIMRNEFAELEKEIKARMEMECVFDKGIIYEIVLPNNYSKVLETAYSELREFVERTTGAIGEKKIFGCERGEKAIYLGCGEATKRRNIDVSYALLGSSGVVIKQDESIVIAGATDIAVLYGVYELLELFGVQFFARDEIKADYIGKVVISGLDRTIIPDINTRHIGYFEAIEDPLTASRLRVISNDMFFEGNNRARAGEAMKGDILYGVWGGLWAHTMLSDILPVEYNERGEAKRPDFYSADLTQICFTSVDARLAFTESLKKFILASPKAEYFMLGISDNNTSCQCEACRKSNALYTVSGTHIRFINAVARDIATWQKSVLPDSNFTLCAFAYNEYKNAPVKIGADGEYTPIDSSVVLEDNVAIMVAPLDACGAHSINCDCNKRVRERFLGWRAVSSKLIVWDYHTYFDNYFLYMPTIDTYQANIQFYRSCGAKYVYNEGALYAQSSGFAELKVYVLSKLLWDSSRDVASLVTDFFTHFYKGASSKMLEYYFALGAHFSKLERDYLEKGQKGYHTAFETVWQPDVLSQAHYPLEFVNSNKKLLLSALDLALRSHDMVVARRVKKEMLFIYFLELELHSCYCDKLEHTRRIEAFGKLCSEVGITNYKHGYHSSSELHYKAKLFSWECRWPARVDNI